jgi:alpha-tubulin suppressor-like RCC1 family protein
MRQTWVCVLAVLAGCVLGSGSVRGQDAGSIVGWGEQVVVPPSSLTGLVAVAGGGHRSLGLKADGSIVAWGWNNYGQCDVPAPNSGFIAVAGGGYQTLRQR